MEKLKENLENNQNLDETINSENNKEPFIINRRNPLGVFFWAFITSMFLLASFIHFLSPMPPLFQKIIAFFIFLFFLHAIYSILFLDYIACYDDKIIIKKYIFREIVIFKKDITHINWSGNGLEFLFGNLCMLVVKKKICVIIYWIPALSDEQCWKLR